MILCYCRKRGVVKLEHGLWDGGEIMNQNYAGGGRRFVAALVDGLIIGVVNLLIGFLVGLVLKNQVVSFGLSLLVGILYYVVYQAFAGQTLGKRALGVKVLTVEGSSPSAITFFLREIIGKTVSGVILAIGYLMILWDGKRQGLHDKIAGTVVVRV